jgi:hypothetical protein
MAGGQAARPVCLDDPKLRVCFDQSFLDKAKFADPLRSELNPLREPGRYLVAPGFDLVVVV